MAHGTVNVINENLNQGAAPRIEQTALFVGVSEQRQGELVALNAQSDIDALLGSPVSQLKTQVKAAQQNGGEVWSSWAVAHAPDDDWRDVVSSIINHVSPECIVNCTPATTTQQLHEAQSFAEQLRTRKAKRVFVLQALSGIDGNLNTWSEYTDGLSAIVNNVSAYRLCAVPLLHGNDVGALAGRLCNRRTSVADSPMRIVTGPVLALGQSPNDINGQPLTDAILKSLDALRITTIQHYTDYVGTFFGDANMLDAPGGDYQVIENLRVIDKLARRVRLLCIPLIANRAINSTPVSQQDTKNLLSKPAREMASTITLNGRPVPGEIYAPTDKSIELQWQEGNQLSVYISVRPYRSPKAITASISLDLQEV